MLIIGARGLLALIICGIHHLLFHPQIDALKGELDRLKREKRRIQLGLIR